MGEKRFPASLRKLKKAREEGDVAKSRDLTLAISVIAGLACIFRGWHILLNRLLFLPSFKAEPLFLSIDFLLQCINISIVVFAEIVGPFLLIVFLSSATSELAQIGFFVSLKAVTPNWSRVGLQSGLKRILGIDPAGGSLVPVQFFYAFLKQMFVLCALCGLMLFSLIKLIQMEFVHGPRSTISECWEVLKWSVSSCIWPLCLLLVAWSSLDWIYQRHQRTRRLMMDREEFKREMRETEGDPALRAMRKQLHQETLWSEVLHRVRRSKVVIVGDTSE